jgi:hypothetical protein
MTEKQRTISGYKSQIHEQEDFEDVNAGKPFLDDVTEYVLQLTESPRVIASKVTKKKKDGSEIKVDAEKAVCEFEEKNTKNKVVAFFRVDSLNFAQTQDEEQFESGVIRFFKKLKHPLVEGVAPDWDNYFIPGMRFRGRVVPKRKVDKANNVVMIYYLDIPTVRPLLPSDKAGEDFAREAPMQQPAPAIPTAIPNPNLANALLLAHGAKTHQEAMDMLSKAQASKEVAMALFQANLDGLLKFPI